MSHTARKKSNAERKAKQRSVLFICALDVWSLGNGKGGLALYNTLIGYASRGWKVYFITGNRGDISGHDLHENINIIRFDALWLKKMMKIKKSVFSPKLYGGFIFRLFHLLLQFTRGANINLTLFMGMKSMERLLLSCYLRFGVCPWFRVSREQVSELVGITKDFAT